MDSSLLLKFAHITGFISLGGTPHRLSRAFFGREGGVESGPGFQHGAGDVEEAVSD